FLCRLFYSSARPRPPTSPPFPYTTLFRSPMDRSSDKLPAVRGDEPRSRWQLARLVRRGDTSWGRLLVTVHIARRANDFFRLPPRSEEHTSELQSRENLVCRLLLEKKKKNR